MMRYEKPILEVLILKNTEDVMTSSTNELQWQENEESDKGNWSEWL